jgi:hypothetical protein
MNNPTIPAEQAGRKGGRPGPCIGFVATSLYAPSKLLTHARTGKPSAKGVDTSMKTFHEWLAERQQRQCEGLWLNDKLAVPGMSNVNPLMQKKVKGRKQTPAVKPLKPKPMVKALKQMPGIA